MIPRATLLILPFFLFAPLLAKAEDTPAAIPFFLSTPDGWRTETIPFPLGFAPELDYEGLEEIRFAPGMFDAESPDFFTYTFVWWIEEDSSITAEGLAEDMEAYFSGLMKAVAEQGKVDASQATYSAHFEKRDAAAGADFVGTAEVFDAFVTADMIRLNIRVQEIRCTESKQLAVIFGLSPKPVTDPVWTDLEAIRRAFRCQR